MAALAARADATAAYIDDSDVFSRFACSRYSSFQFVSHFWFFSVKRWCHFRIITVLARSIGSGSIRALFPLHLPIIVSSVAASGNISDIDAVVGKSVIFQVIFVCTFANINCPAFFMLRAVNRPYRVVGCCLQHTHSFHRSHGRCYARNRKPTAKQKSHVMG